MIASLKAYHALKRQKRLQLGVTPGPIHIRAVTSLNLHSCRTTTTRLKNMSTTKKALNESSACTASIKSNELTWRSVLQIGKWLASTNATSPGPNLGGIFKHWLRPRPAPVIVPGGSCPKHVGTTEGDSMQRQYKKIVKYSMRGLQRRS